MAKRKRDWAWRRLAESGGKVQPTNYRRPDFMTNAQGRTVRQHAPHPKKAAIRRFFSMTTQIKVGDDYCLVWKGGDTFRVDDDTVTTPARFYWWAMRTEKLRDGDKLRRACKTPHCVKHKKLCKAKQSSNPNECHI